MEWQRCTTGYPDPDPDSDFVLVSVGAPMAMGAGLCEAAAHNRTERCHAVISESQT